MMSRSRFFFFFDVLVMQWRDRRLVHVVATVRQAPGSLTARRLIDSSL
jgi:hypothetical protein